MRSSPRCQLIKIFQGRNILFFLNVLHTLSCTFLEDGNCRLLLLLKPVLFFLYEPTPSLPLQLTSRMLFPAGRKKDLLLKFRICKAAGFSSAFQRKKHSYPLSNMEVQDISLSKLIFLFLDRRENQVRKILPSYL